MNMKCFLMTAAACAIISPGHAQNKGAFDPNEGVKQAGMVTPTVIDKMIAVNMVLGKGKVDWKGVGGNYANYMSRDDYNDKNVMLPVMMGLRMSDGVLSIMARDVELLNKAAADIEFMADKLGVGGSELRRAARVKAFANKKDWNRVFLELGYLQKDIMATMAKEGNRDRRAILISAGWIEGAHMMSSVIKTQCSKDASGLLREPLLVKQMLSDLDKLDAKKKSDPVIVEMVSVLKKLLAIIDVPLHASIAKEKIEEMHKITSQFRRLVIGNKR